MQNYSGIEHSLHQAQVNICKNSVKNRNRNEDFFRGINRGIMIARSCNPKRLLRFAPLRGDYTGSYGLESKCRMRGASFPARVV